MSSNSECLNKLMCRFLEQYLHEELPKGVWVRQTPLGQRQTSAMGEDWGFWMQSEVPWVCLSVQQQGSMARREIGNKSQKSCLAKSIQIRIHKKLSNFLLDDLFYIKVNNFNCFCVITVPQRGEKHFLQSCSWNYWNYGKTALALKTPIHQQKESTMGPSRSGKDVQAGYGFLTELAVHRGIRDIQQRGHQHPEVTMWPLSGLVHKHNWNVLRTLDITSWIRERTSQQIELLNWPNDTKAT